MSFNSNLPTVNSLPSFAKDCCQHRRRRFAFALAMAPFAAWASTDPLSGLQLKGRGEFRYLGFLVYEATLWAGNDPQQPPLALRLDYKRDLKGKAIAEASVREMRQLGADETRLLDWQEKMTGLFPDIKRGDYLLGVYEPARARFIHNGAWLGEIADAEFARYFFGIWLDPRSSSPELRTALLQRQSRP